ncbi:uncharacterized protein VTP21DRAFT_9112 [Calcarisporiella thermophila]|uniref:uncharacterized protein n=1 Tax=Calcarisporiella thermophila TaxID=911321 RepID=UPI003743183C
MLAIYSGIKLFPGGGHSRDHTNEKGALFLSPASFIPFYVSRAMSANEHPASPKTLPVHGALHRDEPGDLEKGESQLHPPVWRRSLWKVLQAKSDIDPRSYSHQKKTVILLIIALAGVIAPLSTTIYYPSLLTIEKEMATSNAAVNATVSIFIFCTGAAPLAWATFSEAFGTRRLIYLVTFAIYVIASVGCALANNIYTLIILRIFQALGGSAVQSLGAGTIADVWETHERGFAFGLFYIGPLVGPIIGPVLGGFLGEYISWRSTFYFLAIFGGVVWVLILAALPETFRYSKPTISPTPTTSSDEEDPTSSPKSHRQHGTLNPFRSLLLLRYPFVVLITLTVALLYSSIYTINIMLPHQAHDIYRFDESKTGLIYLAMGGGLIVGSVLGGKICDYSLMLARSRKGHSTPEDRLTYNVYIGGLLFSPAGLLVYAWLSDGRYSIAIPLVGLFFVGLGIMMVANSTSTYLVDALSSQSASAMAVNNFGRNLMGTFATLVGPLLSKAIGYGWLATLLAVASLVAVGLALVIYKHGEGWREKAGLNG